MTTWVFPVGHYLGPYFPGPGQEVESHRVRVGDDVVKLATETEFLVWGLAHGLPDALPDGAVWTRDTLLAFAAQRSGADSAAAFHDLLAVGALVEVGPDGVDPAVFARTHRLRPLLSGLGVGPGRPGRYQLGVFGEEPVAVVDERVFDLWQWAPRVGTLGDLDDLQDATASLLGDATDGVAGLLHRVHLLLANGCGYLDAATST